MSMMNTDTTYGSVAKFFHWLLFIILLFMVVFGYFLEDFPKDVQPTTYNIHKLTGLTILLLMTLRLFWKLINPRPALPIDMPTWQRWASNIVQWSLYVVVIAMPIVGWIGSSASGHAPHIGDINLLLPIEKSEQIDDVSFYIHNQLALVLIGLVSLHFLGALYHHFIRKDDVLRRMLPSRRHY